MPKKIKIFASAKINLCLDIIEKDKNGCHKIQTVFHEIPTIRDELEIFETQEKDHTSILNPDQKTPVQMEDNLAHRALLLIKKRYSIKKFAEIKISKNIPLSGGLGGGSSDAAAVLKALNKMWQLALTDSELISLAAQLGNDVPFFILGGTALGTHYGEKVEPLPTPKGVKFEIQTKSSNDPRKTSSMFSKIKIPQCCQNIRKTAAFITALNENNPDGLIKNIHNDFETVSGVPSGWHLSGSGPSLFRVHRS